MARVENIVQDFLKYMGNRDLGNLISLFSGEVDWYIPGDEKRISWLGKRNKIAEVSVFFESLWANTLPISSSIGNVFIKKSSAVIMGEFSVKMLPTGQYINSLFFIFLDLDENGKISKYRLLEDSFMVSESMNPQHNSSLNATSSYNHKWLF